MKLNKIWLILRRATRIDSIEPHSGQASAIGDFNLYPSQHAKTDFSTSARWKDDTEAKQRFSAFQAWVTTGPEARNEGVQVVGCRSKDQEIDLIKPFLRRQLVWNYFEHISFHCMYLG